MSSLHTQGISPAGTLSCGGKRISLEIPSADGMEKNPKACEPCRRRKVRCDGRSPCNRCERKPSECVYRLRTRVRKSGAQRAAAANASRQTPAPGTPNGPDKQSTPRSYPTDNASASPTDLRRTSPEGTGPKSALAIYQGIAAAHEDIESIESRETSGLFYGPACMSISALYSHPPMINLDEQHSSPSSSKCIGVSSRPLAPMASMTVRSRRAALV